MSRKSENESDIVFVICPIGSQDSDIRKRSDQILKYIIKPAAEELGYKAIRADDLSAPGMITNQIISHLVNDPLVIADLTGYNPNVFYELAVRHAVKKPVILLKGKEEKLPFDIAGLRAITVDLVDIVVYENAKKELFEQIKSVKKDPSKFVDSPITSAVKLESLSESPVQDVLIEMYRSLEEIKRRLPFPIRVSHTGELYAERRPIMNETPPTNNRVSTPDLTALESIDREIRRLVEKSKKRANQK